MGEVLGLDTGVNLPSMASGMFGGTMTYILLGIIVFIILAILLYVIMTHFKFNKKIILFENVSGQGYQVTYRDRAKLVKLGDGGEEILYLRKKKVFRAAYGKKMGKNTYWFAVGQDGYWYNVTLGDLDAKMGMLDIEPIDRDMRYMHVAIRKNIAERYRKESFMQKYGTILFSGIFLIIMIIAIWLLIDQVGELIEQATGAIEASKQAMEPAVKALSHADTICSGGSGVVGA